MSNDIKTIYDKLTELFICKNKTFDPVTAKVWTEKLNEKFKTGYVIKAIEKMIWYPDDFPTLGKLADTIGETVEQEATALFNRAVNDPSIVGTYPEPLKKYLMKYNLQKISLSSELMAKHSFKFYSIFKSICIKNNEALNYENEQKRII